jgi:crossover junction endodeoxyribonuclease RusA
MITLTIPFAPTLNHMWGYAGKRKYLKKEVHEFRAKVTEAAIEANAKINGRLAIFIALYPATKRKFDIDNRVKAILDALQLAGVFLDDEQVDFLWVVRRPVVQGGMCKVVLVEYNKVHQMLEQYEDYI